MGDGDGGAVACDAVQGGLHDAFASHVNGAGGFIEDEDFGFADDAAGDGDALALAAGELGACISYLGVVALGGDESVRDGPWSRKVEKQRGGLHLAVDQ